MKTYFTIVNFFNKIVILSLFITVEISNGQTWVKTPYYDINSGIITLQNDSTHVGPLEMCKTFDGNVIALIQDNQDGDIKLYRFDSIGNFSWEIFLAHSPTLSHESCFSLCPTSDGGCVYVVRHSVWGEYDRDRIFKLNSTGGIVWSKDYNPMFESISPLVTNIVQSDHNTLYIMFSDSLEEVNINGNYIQSLNSISGKVTALSGNEFILASASTISRRDISGNIFWTINSSGNVFLTLDSTFFYLKGSSILSKYQLNNGDSVWSKNFPYWNCSGTYDGGIIAVNSFSDPFAIDRFDSSGALIWSRSIPFTYFGNKIVIESNPNYFVTGGAFKSTYLYRLGLNQAYGFSPILFQVDSSGLGVVDSTNYFFMGNANDNTILNFADDACYVAAALSSSGPARSVALGNWPFRSVFATDWEGQFGSGINFKYSDVNGDGYLDSTDIEFLSNIYPFSSIVPSHWRTSNNNSDLPELVIKFDRDTLSPGDSLRAFLILGSSVIPVDSIYSLSVSFYNYLDFSLSQFNILQSNFGNTASNLFSFYYSTPQFQTGFVVSRNDHQNAFVNGDTIAIYNFITNISIRPGLNTYPLNYNAITESGFPVLLNTIYGKIYVRETTDLKSLLINPVKIFPNPANDIIFFSFENEKFRQLLIIDNMGNERFKINNPKKEFKLNISDFANGVYIVSLESETNIFKTKFIVAK